MYARLPEALRVADSVNGYALKTYLSALGDIQSDVDTLVARFSYEHPEDRPVEGNLYEPHSLYYNTVRLTANNTSFNYAVGSGMRRVTTDGTFVWSEPQPGVLRMECIADGTNQWTDSLNLYLTRPEGDTTSTLAVTSEDDIEIGIEFRWGPAGRMHNIRRFVQFYDAGDVLLGSGTANNTFGLPPMGEWKAVKFQFSPLPDSTKMVARIQSASAGAPSGVGFRAGDWMEFRFPILTKNMSSEPFFNGNTEDTEEYDYSWVGTEQASASQKITYNVDVSLIDGSDSDLVSAENADPEWLEWLGQLVGVNTRLLSEEESRQAISSGGFQTGSKASLMAVVKSVLSGSKYSRIYPNSNDTDPIGDGTEWEVLVVTKFTETPGTSADLIDVIERSQMRPAGVVIYHKTYASEWQAVEAAFPTWADWEGKSWATIEEAGLA